MQYYNPDNNSSRRWAWLAAGLYGALLAAAFLFVSVDASLPVRQADAILVEFEEPKVPDPPVPSRPAVISVRTGENTPPAVVEPEHTQIDDEESFDQAKGSDEATRTVNPKALFKMAKDGPDEPEDTGNPKAPEGKANTASGTGSGLDAVSGNLDKGLEGRGLVGALPKPDYKANVTGKVIIDVTVDAAGRVTSAEFHAQGSTTSNATLVEAAKRAAMKARFTESASFVQGGMITYVFKMN